MSPSSTFEAGRPEWLGRLGRVRNVVRQEVIARHLARHLPDDASEPPIAGAS